MQKHIIALKKMQLTRANNFRMYLNNLFLFFSLCSNLVFSLHLNVTHPPAMQILNYHLVNMHFCRLVAASLLYYVLFHQSHCIVHIWVHCNWTTSAKCNCIILKYIHVIAPSCSWVHFACPRAFVIYTSKFKGTCILSYSSHFVLFYLLVLCIF